MMTAVFVLLIIAVLSIPLFVISDVRNWDLGANIGVGIFVGSLILALLIALVGCLISENSGKFELLKSEWDCSQSHTETRTNLVMVGKMFIPRTYTSTVCDTYSRKQ